jgi:hypothetical protein
MFKVPESYKKQMSVVYFEECKVGMDKDGKVIAESSEYFVYEDITD